MLSARLLHLAPYVRNEDGNKYPAWAYMEAADFAVRYCPQIKRYYQSKRAKTNGIVAIKTVAHKLARACY